MRAEEAARPRRAAKKICPGCRNVRGSFVPGDGHTPRGAAGEPGCNVAIKRRMDTMSQMNPVVHFEMPAEDRNRMAAFYQRAFGWKTQMFGPEMGDYVLVTTAESDVKPGAPAGAINGGFFPKKPDWPAQYPSIVIGVDDIDSAML